MQRFFRVLPPVLLTAGLSMTTQAATVGGHVLTGYEYDSNLNVDELNQSSGESGNAWVLGAGAEAEGQPLQNLTITGTYDFTSRDYRDSEDFDRALHLASLDLSYDFDAVTVGASHHYSHATLASDPFLDYNRSSVYVGKLVGDDVYLRASLLDKRKDFEDNEARDARTRGVSLDSFFFFNQTRTVFILGADGDDENAESDAYDYRMLAVKTRLKHRFPVAGHDHELKLGWRYEARDYDEPVSSVENPLTSPLLGSGAISSEPRDDRIATVDASYGIGLTEWLMTEARIEYIDYRSSLDSAAYDETVASLNLRAEF
ncbi:surface lipoprotein assembly modifier [Marinobacter sediminum]|uniref:surface lipoprotein assembly modifier n=1 Tax=Marinobacter sediminum TaxID=256323 RepID=UPI00193A18BE|nr:surface lipoprotein assembly modifier [Marinobacter sediminum]